MMEAKILSHSKVWQGHAFDVEKALVRLPNGKERHYDLVDHAPAVTLLPIDQEGNVLFVTQFRVGAQSKLLELPAGVIDPGEDPDTCARRELREETGMDSHKLQKLGEYFMVAGYSNELMHAYLAEDLFESPLSQDEDEFLKLSRVPLIDVYHRAFAGQIQDSKTLSTLLLALPILIKSHPEIKSLLP